MMLLVNRVHSLNLLLLAFLCLDNWIRMICIMQPVSSFTPPHHHRHHHVNKINKYHKIQSRYHSSSPSTFSTSIYSTYRTNNNGRSQPTSSSSSGGSNRNSNSGNGEDKTELNRTKLLLSQARGNLQESEMRATAAEHRVARLQQEMKLLKEKKNHGQIAIGEEEAEQEEEQEEGENENKKKDMTKMISDLKSALKDLNNKMQNEIEKMQSAHAKERKEFESRERELQDDINKANAQHKDALMEVSDLKGEVDKLDKEMKRITLQATKNMDELKASHDKAITSMQMDALEVQSSLEMVNTNLETKLMDEKQQSDNLRLEMINLQKESAEKIQSIKHQANVEINGLKSDLLFHKEELNDRNNQIEELETERSRVRTLAKIQLSLVKARIVKRYNKIFKRGQK